MKKKNVLNFIFLIIFLLSIFFLISNLLPNIRKATNQDYLYYQSSYGFLGIGMGTEYEIGSFSNKNKQKNKFGNVVYVVEYNKQEDNIYLATLGECTVKIISRDGHKSDLNFCVLKDRALTYGVEGITFDKKNYKYLTLSGGSAKKPLNAILVFNDKQEVIKDVRAKYRIDSLVVLDHAIVFTQLDETADDIVVKDLNIYDLKTDKLTTIDLRKKDANIDSISALLQLDNDYLIAYWGKDDYNYVINSKGKFVSKRNKEIRSITPSYEINGKWYKDDLQGKYEESSILEYSNNSIRWINYGKICTHYSSVKFNNKSVYCISKKDNKKLISILDTDNNIYIADKKYEYYADHDMALFGFK